jgi:hypothetical protein
MSPTLPLINGSSAEQLVLYTCAMLCERVRILEFEGGVSGEYLGKSVSLCDNAGI